MQVMNKGQYQELFSFGVLGGGLREATRAVVITRPEPSQMNLNINIFT
jgi:hypothetical protein